MTTDLTADALRAHELALCAINEGDTYPERCALARRHNSVQAFKWACYVDRYARLYHRRFGEAEMSVYDTFPPATLLLAASELAEYYARHVAEMDAAS